MSRRFATSILMLLLVFGSALTPQPARAQDGDFCQNADEETCAVLEQSTAAMRALPSANTALDLNIFVSNVPDVPFDTLAIDLAHTSSFSATADGAEAASALHGILDGDGAALLAEPAQTLDLYYTMLTNRDVSSNVEIELSDDAVALLEARLARLTDPVPLALPNTFSIDGRLADGTLYANVGDIADLVPGVISFGDIWFGLEFEALLGFIVERQILEADIAAMDAEEATLVAQLVQLTTGYTAGPLITEVDALGLPFDALPFLQVEIEDEDDELVTLRTTVDYAKVLREPAVQELIAAQLRDGALGAPMSDGEIEQILTLAQFAGPAVLESLGLQAEEVIDRESGRIVERRVTLDLDVSQFASLAAMAGAGDLFNPETLPVVTFDMTLINEEPTAAVAIDAPESVIIFSSAELLDLARGAGE